MLLSDETSDDGQRRIYFTRVGSVVSYFTDDESGGVAVHVEPGEFACRWSTTQAKLDAVRESMLEETARRLHIRPDQVQLMTMNDIGQVCDPHHLHIVVNRIHPETAKAWDRWKDWPRIEKSLGRQAREHGLIYVPGRHNAPEQYREVATKARNSEFRRAERLGTKDELRPRWTREQIVGKRAALAPLFEQVRNWGELERALAQHVVGLERKGQGIVIGDATGTMKLSDLGKQIRLGMLEDRFAETWESYEQRRGTPEPADHKAGATDDDTSTALPAKPQPQLPTLEHPRLPRDKRSAPGDGDEATDITQASPQLLDDGDGATSTAKPRIRQAESPAEPPPMDWATFAAKWKQRAAALEAKRTDDERKKAAEAQAREAAEIERRRRADDHAETMRKLKDKFAPIAQREPQPQKVPERDAAPPPATQPQPERSPQVEARAAAHDTKAKADAEADLAFKLHAAGLVTRKQLARSVRERENAQAELDKHATGQSKLRKELRQALVPQKPATVEDRDPRRHAAKPSQKLKDKGDKSR